MMAVYEGRGQWRLNMLVRARPGRGLEAWRNGAPWGRTDSDWLRVKEDHILKGTLILD